MSNRNADKAVLVLGKRLWEFDGSFVCLAGAGTVVASTVKGWGFGYSPVAGVMTLKPTATSGIISTPGIVRTAVGVFTLTFEDTYLEVVNANAWLMGPGPNVNDAAIRQAVTNVASSNQAPTFTIDTFNGATGAAADLGTTYSVGFRVKFRDSSANYNRP